MSPFPARGLPGEKNRFAPVAKRLSQKEDINARRSMNDRSFIEGHSTIRINIVSRKK
jgi:hypothetical protein